MGKDQTGKELTFRDYFVPFTTLKAIHFIVLVGLLLYANSLFNAFVLDDHGQIVTNPNVHTITSIPNIFLNVNSAQLTSDYYRPLPHTVYAVLYSLFQTNTFFYHLTQVILHICNASLIFILFKKYLKLRLAFLLALLFLVHPITEETVVYIANLQDVVFVFFGLLAFVLLQKKSETVQITIFANVCLFLALLSKESAIVFIVVTAVYVYWYKRNCLKVYSLSLIVLLIVYATMRLIANVSLEKDAIIPIMEMSLEERLIQIPSILFYYIKTLLWPTDLFALHTWVIKEITIENFAFPLFAIIVFFSLLIVLSGYTYNKTKEKKLIILFWVWFIVGIGIHLQLVPLDMTVADHYFYFPFIGLLGLLGLSMQEISFRRLPKTLTIFVIALLLVLSVRTAIRNYDWRDQNTLITHDQSAQREDYLQELLYGVELYNQAKFDEASFHVSKALSYYPRSAKAWSTQGAIQYKIGNVDKAKEAFQKAIALNNYYAAYDNMALLLWEHEGAEKTRDFTREATKRYPKSQQLWFYRLLSEYKTGNLENALLAAKEYSQLKNDQQSYDIYLRLQQNLPLTIQ